MPLIYTFDSKALRESSKLFPFSWNSLYAKNFVTSEPRTHQWSDSFNFSKNYSITSTTSRFKILYDSGWNSLLNIHYIYSLKRIALFVNLKNNNLHFISSCLGFFLVVILCFFSLIPLSDTFLLCSENICTSLAVEVFFRSGRQFKLRFRAWCELLW